MTCKSAPTFARLESSFLNSVFFPFKNQNVKLFMLAGNFLWFVAQIKF
jgi:hypothetical protein